MLELLDSQVLADAKEKADFPVHLDNLVCQEYLERKASQV